jgi:hypothetical protein
MTCPFVITKKKLKTAQDRSLDEQTNKKILENVFTKSQPSNSRKIIDITTDNKGSP